MVHHGVMRVALVAESFLPQSNGVVNSLLRVLEHLERRGDQAIVIAPEGRGGEGPDRYGSAEVVRLPAMGWPGYHDVRVALVGSGRVARALERFDPDVVHLASPFVLGWTAVRACEELHLPSVAIYQTEVPSYADRYGMPWGEGILWDRVRSIHQRADLTLAPSSFAMRQLELLGVDRLRLWPRGVDSERFHPRHRSQALHDAWAPQGEIVVGYVGRLAPEKQVQDLTRLAGLPGVRLVIVGDGPSREALKRAMPDAVLTGHLGGAELAQAMATLDVMVHTGELETFCQTIQEALASGVPVVAPRRGGPIDLVHDGASGHLYTPGDLGEMAAHVRGLVEDAGRREAFGAHARASVERNTWEHVCDRLIGSYEEAIALHHARPARPWDVQDEEVVLA